jgi:hypothetical protein
MTSDCRNPLDLAVGATAMVVATALAAALFPDAQTVARLAVMAAAIGGCAALLTRALPAVAVAAIGFLLHVGFLVNERGELTWDGLAALWELLMIAVATGAGLLCRWVRKAGAEAAVDAELREMLNSASSPDRNRPT